MTFGVVEDPPVPLQGERYGGKGTIHQTGKVDVEIGPDGHVVAVWFRCLTLPFEEHRVDDGRAKSMQLGYLNHPPARLIAVEIERQP